MAHGTQPTFAHTETASGSTRKMTPEELCVATIPSGTKTRVEMYNIILDRSRSVGDSNLESLFSKGVPTLVKRIAGNSGARARIALVRIVAFGTGLEVLLDWTEAKAACDKAASLSAPKASGVTRLDLAIRDGMAAIDRMKKAIDESQQTILRGGAVNLVVTDGRLTDERGNEIPVPDDLAAEIATRQSRRTTSFIILGIGKCVAADQLALLAPPVVLKNGTKVPQAAMYSHSIQFDKSEDEDHFWITVAQIVADAPSKDSTPSVNEAIVSFEGFEIAGA